MHEENDNLKNSFNFNNLCGINKIKLERNKKKP